MCLPERRHSELAARYDAHLTAKMIKSTMIACREKEDEAAMMGTISDIALVGLGKPLQPSSAAYVLGVRRITSITASSRFQNRGTVDKLCSDRNQIKLMQRAS